MDTEFFITTCTTARHLFVSRIRSIQRTNLQFFKSTLILSSHLSLGLLSGFLSRRFPHRHPPRTALLPHTCHIPCLSHLSGFHYTVIIWWGEQIMQLLGSPSSSCTENENSEQKSKCLLCLLDAYEVLHNCCNYWYHFVTHILELVSQARILYRLSIPNINTTVLTVIVSTEADKEHT